MEAAAIDASDIVFYVAGINGANGNLGATPKAAQIWLNNTADANFHVPSGTLWIRPSTEATGAYIGKDVLVGIGATVSHDSAFSESMTRGRGQGRPRCCCAYRNCRGRLHRYARGHHATPKAQDISFQ